MTVFIPWIESPTGHGITVFSRKMRTTVPGCTSYVVTDIRCPASPCIQISFSDIVMFHKIMSILCHKITKNISSNRSCANILSEIYSFHPPMKKSLLRKIRIRKIRMKNQIDFFKSLNKIATFAQRIERMRQRNLA